MQQSGQSLPRTLHSIDPLLFVLAQSVSTRLHTPCTRLRIKFTSRPETLALKEGVDDSLWSSGNDPLSGGAANPVEEGEGGRHRRGEIATESE